MVMTLGFSPCPNDTFIFDALVNSKIDTGDLSFEPVLEDVQTLNNWAREERLDLSKISYGVWPLVSGAYDLLDAGGALGKGVGPLLIARKPIDPAQVSECTIAIPGITTTAHLLFSLAFPGAHQKKFMLFSSIEDAVLRGDVDCGVIIHENRFTYQDKGLVKLMDLGEYWERETKAPIPLGGIVAKKGIEPAVKQRINDLIVSSIQYSWSAYPALSDYIRFHSQEMDETVMRKHIDLYVNDYSLSLGHTGHRAVETLVRTHAALQLPV